MRLFRTVLAVAGLFTVLSTPARAAGCDSDDPASSVKLTGGGCFSFHASSQPRPGAPLVVFLHGDGGGHINSAYWDSLKTTGNALAAATNTTFVVLVRPGYRSPGGRSSGEAKAGDDDYTPANVLLAAEAVSALKARFRPSRVIVGGISGGAATAALIMGRHPGVADAAWLTACPCQIQPWRAWRMQSAGRTTPWSSLSPDQHVAGVAPGVRIAVVSGEKDTNTLPAFSEPYVAALRDRGIDARLILAPGATHSSVWRSPEAAAALAALVR